MNFDGLNGFDTDLLIVFGFPLVIVALSFAYSAYQRHLRHKERMALIEKGIAPAEWSETEEEQPWRSSRRSSTSSGVGVTLVGIAITLGLLTLGIGPWLIGGLVPTAVGCSMIIQQLMEESRKKRDERE